MKRVTLTPVEHALAIMGALTLADMVFVLPWTGRLSLGDVAESVADAIPSGVAVALLARRRSGPLTALLAAVLVCAWALVAGPAARATSVSGLEREVSTYASDVYLSWSGPVLVLGTALSFFAASRLRGHPVEGVALAAPEALTWFVHIVGHYGLGREVVLSVLAFAVTLAVLVPLLERGVAFLFAKLGITDSEATP